MAESPNEFPTTMRPCCFSSYRSRQALARCLLLLGMTVVPPARGAEPIPDDLSEIQPFLNQYCADCHTGDDAEGGLDVTAYADVAALHADRRTWGRVFDRLRVKAMPPDDAEQPTDEERQRAVDWLREHSARSPEQSP